MITAHAEYGKIKKIYLNRSSDSYIDDNKIASEWKELNYLGKPHIEGCNEEYMRFEGVIKDHSEEVVFFGQNEGLTLDSIYCRDASITTDFGVILCNMGKDGRRKGY